MTILTISRCILPPVLALSLVCNSLAASIESLGNVYTNGFTFPRGVSDNGIVVGFTSPMRGGQLEGQVPGAAFVWTLTNRFLLLPNTEGSDASTASAISADGSTIIGEFLYEPKKQIGPKAFRWFGALTSKSSTLLLSNALSSATWASGVSADGSTIVGHGYWPGNNISIGFRWTESSGPLPIRLVPPSRSESGAAVAVSADGSVVTGYATPGGIAPQQAYRQSAIGGLEMLGALEGYSYSAASAISGDGRVVVGTCQSLSQFPYYQAFRWAKETGMTAIAPLTNASRAVATDSSGAVIVGFWDSRAVIDDSPSDTSFYWTLQDGIRTLHEVLAERGVDSHALGWDGLHTVTAISPNGRYIVGWGDRKNSNSEPFLIDMGERNSPEPIEITLKPATNGRLLLLWRPGSFALQQASDIQGAQHWNQSDVSVTTNETGWLQADVPALGARRFFRLKAH